MTISRAEFQIMEDRCRRGRKVPFAPESTPCDDEGELQQQIADYCRSNAWPYFWQRMDKRSRGTVGWPDFTILLPREEYAYDARVVFVECKRKGGKLSLEQNAIVHHFAKVGHKLHVVFSFEEFLKLI